jgi:hypothetical protein
MCYITMILQYIYICAGIPFIDKMSYLMVLMSHMMITISRLMLTIFLFFIF